MSASEQSNGPARHREIEGWAAAVLSGLLIGSAAPDPHKGNFLLHRSCVNQVSLQLVTGLTKLMRWDVQSFRHGLAVRQSSAEVPRSAQLPGLAWVKEAG